MTITYIPVGQESQQTVLGPSTSLFHTPQIPTFFHLSLQTMRDGTASTLVLPSGVQVLQVILNSTCGDKFPLSS